MRWKQAVADAMELDAHEAWGMTRRKGHRDALISLETFTNIQTRKSACSIPPGRKDIHEDVPFRAAVNRFCCNKPMTSR
ncbi:MAG: hypothetical protein AAF231_08250 [Pseudomonadota bacterium]